MSQQKQPTDTSEYWPCACVKRDKDGHLTHIKGHARAVAKCRRCGCTRDAADKIHAEAGR